MKAKLLLVVITLAFTLTSCGILPGASWIFKKHKEALSLSDTQENTEPHQEATEPEPEQIFPFPIELANIYQGNWNKKAGEDKEKCSIEIRKAWTNAAGTSFMNLSVTPDLMSGYRLQCSETKLKILDDIEKRGTTVLNCVSYLVTGSIADDVAGTIIGNLIMYYRLTLGVDDINDFNSFKIDSAALIIPIWTKLIKCTDLEVLKK